MITLYNRDAFSLDISDSQAASDQVTRLLEQDPYMDKMFLLYKRDNLVGAAALDMLLEGKLCFHVFPLEGDFFLEAREYCSQKEVPYGSAFPLVNAEGVCEEILIYEKNNIFHNSRDTKARCYNSFADYNFDCVENLDFTLFDAADSVIFLQLEEYTYAIAKLLLKCFPQKQLVCCDEKMSRFLPEVKYFESLEECLALKKRVIISSEKYNYSCGIPDCITNVYNSINVMYSLLWTQKRESFGERYPNSTIFLIDFSTENAGLVDIMKFTATFVLIARQRGWIPVVCLNRQPNQYLNSTTENMWEYFFEPVSDITVQEVFQCKHVIRCSENGIRLNEFRINLFYRALEKLLFVYHGRQWRQLIRLNTVCKEAVAAAIPEEIKASNCRVLGVVARGTDLSNEASAFQHRNRAPVASVDTMLRACRWKQKLWNCDYIFLATEDERYFRCFQEEFGDTLLFVNQKRVSHDYTKSYLPVAALLNIRDGKKFGMTYLSVLYSLSKCDVLLYSAKVGAVTAALAMNKNGFDACERIQL